MNDYRFMVVLVLIILSFIDLGLTYYYVHKYKQWQPNKPYNLIERNPLLTFLWNKIGLFLGTLIGGTIIFALVYIIGKEAHWIVVSLLFILLIFTMYNHYININLLHNLIDKYPTGYLPEGTFGKVEGNNPR